jgi:hypothetical protein
MFRKISLLLIIGMLLVGCQPTQLQQAEADTNAAGQPETSSEIPEAEQIVKSACEYNSDCAENLLCIDGSCQTLASLYETECENKCSVKEVIVTTSDGEDYTLALGQGSYTAAGALEWKLLNTPDYCPGTDPLVAINIIKKTTGKILGEQVLTLHKGDTSEEITHPTVKSVKFTATLTEVIESCS